MKPLWVLLLAVSLALGASRDSLTVSVLPIKATGTVLRVPVGIWWPEYDSKAKVKASFPGHAAKKDVVVWFHGGMTSGNCQKGLVAGEAFSDIFPDVVVLSASACKENHWATEVMVSAVDAALDSIARRRRGFVEEVSLVGVSDGSLGVLVYSMYGKRRVKNRLLVSSYGKLLGEAPAVAASPKMGSGKWRFLQGGADRLYPPSETIPWIQEFCKNVGADCDLRYDPSGEHDWSYWQGHHLDWIREAFPFKK